MNPYLEDIVTRFIVEFQDYEWSIERDRLGREIIFTLRYKSIGTNHRVLESDFKDLTPYQRDEMVYLIFRKLKQRINKDSILFLEGSPHEG